MIAINRKPMEMNTFPDGTMLTEIVLLHLIIKHKKGLLQK